VTIASGLLSSAPILVSPESASSIKEGAKTGLSAVVAGVLFLIASLFSPIFEHVPGAGTSPILIMIGVILLQNVARIDWRNITNAAPAFVVLFYIPFTYSIIQGKLLVSLFVCSSLS
jgi:AGZA family xanthine/uracil permease-like MFS transporter